MGMNRRWLSVVGKWDFAAEKRKGRVLGRIEHDWFEEEEEEEEEEGEELEVEGKKGFLGVLRGGSLTMNPLKEVGATSASVFDCEP